MPVKIKRLNKSQVRLLVPILKEVIEKLSYYNEEARSHELTKYNANELLKKIEEDPDSVLIAQEANKIVGFCLSHIDDMLIWLEWFGVVESAREKGIARKLVENLEATVKKRHAHKIWCDCRTVNTKSINLLSSAGYLPICTLNNHWYGQDFILWQKEI